MRRLVLVAAAAVLLSGCTQNPQVKEGLDTSRSGVEKAQSAVERAKDRIQPEVERIVTPYIPERFADQPGFDAGLVEDYLEKSQAALFTDVGEVGDATCPADPELRSTMTVRCTLDVTGTEVPFDVIIKGVGSDEPQVSAAPVGVVIPGSAIAAAAGAKGAQVTCDGGGLLVGQVGDAATCTLAQGPQTVDFTVTIKDDRGRVAIS